MLTDPSPLAVPETASDLAQRALAGLLAEPGNAQNETDGPLRAKLAASIASMLPGAGRAIAAERVTMYLSHFALHALLQA